MATYSLAPLPGEVSTYDATPPASEAHNRDIDMLIGAGGTIEDVSPSVILALGYPADHLVGSLLFRYVNQHELVSFLRHIGAVVGGREDEAETGVRLRGTDGLWHAFQAKVRARLNGQVIVGVILTLHPLYTALAE